MNIMTKGSWLVWLLGLIILGFVFLNAGLTVALKALLPIISAVDLAIWLLASVTELPCAFTEWVCYPLWPLYRKGFGMKTGVLVRIGEITVLVVSGYWLSQTLNALA